MKIILAYFLVMNIIAIIATVRDKSAARNGEDRVSENSLLVLAAAGGGIGMYLAMRIIHHKTRKNKFMVGIPVIILFEIALAAILYFNFF